MARADQESSACKEPFPGFTEKRADLRKRLAGLR